MLYHSLRGVPDDVMMCRLKRITNDLESVQRLASSSVAGGGGGGGGVVGKGGGRGWEGGGSVESRLMMLEQRIEQQERETFIQNV